MKNVWPLIGLAALLLSGPASATNTSTADPTYPQAYQDIDAEPLRSQFDDIINDINNLWAASAPNLLSANQISGALISGKSVGLPIPSCFGVANALIWIPGQGFSCNLISTGGGGGGSLGPAAAFTVLAGPLGGSPANATFRALTGNDLPLPTSNTIGGVQSAAPIAHEFLTGISLLGVPSQAAPSFADISGVAAASQIPFPTSSSLGGTESIAVVAHNFLTGISTAGVPTQAQASFSDISGNISISQMASGSGASSSTFWRGDGTWVTPTPGIQNLALSTGLSASTITCNSSPLSSTSTGLNLFDCVNVYTGNHTISSVEAAGRDVLNSTTTGTFTLPQVGTSGFGNGVGVEFENDNSGALLISTTGGSAMSGMALTTSSVLLRQYGHASCVSDGVSAYRCSGYPGP